MAEQDMQDFEAPPHDAGTRLRLAREGAGLSLADVSARTKIAERHLLAIEEGRLADLASRTYAVGFSRSYARAVGLDETAIADLVRSELASGEEQWQRPQPQSFEPGDPARIPPSRFAWLAGLAALVVIVAGFWLWSSQYDPAVSLPDLTANDEPQVAAAAGTGVAGKTASLAGAAAPSGAVTFTATEPDIWVKFYDATGAQLMQKQMAQGETYTVPADAQGPQLWTARPDALRITIGGRMVPLLSDKPMTMKDVPVTAAALTARPAPTASAPAAAAFSSSAPAPAR